MKEPGYEIVESDGCMMCFDDNHRFSIISRVLVLIKATELGIELGTKDLHLKEAHSLTKSRLEVCYCRNGNA